MIKEFFTRLALVTASVFLVTTLGGEARADLTPGAGRSSEFGIGFHSATLGAGGGGVGLFSSSASALTNPALLSTLEFQELAVTGTSLTNQSYLAAAYWALPITSSQGVAVALSTISTGDISKVQDYAPLGKFSYSSTLATFSFGRRLGPPIYLGATLKILNQSIDNFTDYGIGFDLGFAARPARYLTFGAAVQNAIEPELQLRSTAEVQPRSFLVGISVPSVPLASRVLTTASISVEWFEGYKGRYYGGISTEIDSFLVLRAGYQIDKLTFGLGVRSGRAMIDYAYRFIDVTGDHHSISISFAVGPSLADQSKRREAERRAALDEAERRQRYEQNRLTGKTFFERFELDSALVYYQRALAFDESNQELIGTISSIQEAIATKREADLRMAATEAETRQSIRSYYDQANLLYERGSYRAALDLLTLLLEVQPDNAQALDLGISIKSAVDSMVEQNLRLADSALAAGRNVEAITLFNRVLETEPSNTHAKSGKATAVARLDKAVQLNLAIEAFNKGLLDDAERRFRAVLEASPSGETTASDYLARIAALRQRPAATGTVPSEVVTLDQLQLDRPTWERYLEGLKQMRDRQYEDAIRLWQEVLVIYPNQPQTLENIKQARLRLQSEKGSGR